ncbi:MAG: hypothetical protein AABY22_18720 [Nanoarchaeota archaeon]
MIIKKEISNYWESIPGKIDKYLYKLLKDNRFDNLYEIRIAFLEGLRLGLLL